MSGITHADVNAAPIGTRFKTAYPDGTYRLWMKCHYRGTGDTRLLVVGETYPHTGEISHSPIMFEGAERVEILDDSDH